MTLVKIAFAAIVAGLVALTVTGGLDVSKWLDSANLKALAGTSGGLPEGYRSYRLPVDSPQTYVAVGEPWGTPCTRVVVAAKGEWSRGFTKQVQRVVEEAGQAELDIEVTDAKPDDSDGVVMVSAKSGRPATEPNGRSYRYTIVPGLEETGDPDYSRFTKLKANVYLRAIDGDQALLRASLRAIVAAAAGVDASSTAPRSGLTLELEDAADAFSATDADAMQAMSGCAG